MLVSIIVPIYNSSKYLPACLESIINQTYQKLDIILVDDGSTDTSYLICKKYKLNDSRIRVFQKKNDGVASTRNYGIQQAKGDCILFVDSDDILISTHVESLVSIMQEYKCDVAVTSCAIVKENRNWSLPKNKFISIIKMSGKDAAINMLLSKNIDSCVCCKLVRKYNCEKFRFYDGQKIGEDMAFFLNVFRNSKKVVLKNLKEYLYIQHQDSTLNKVTDATINSLDFFEKLIMNEKDENIKEALCSKYISTCFHFLRLINIESDKTKFINIVNRINKYKKKMIFAKNVAFKVRIAILLSYIDYKLIIKIM